MQFTISQARLSQLLGVEAPLFPKYTTQLLNLANQNAQGTRPSVVGQMSDLIGESKASSISEWKKWYEQQKPEGIEEAVRRIEDMVEKLRVALDQIDRSLIEAWVRDLVVNKTFAGFRVQDAVLAELAVRFQLPIRAANAEEEARGIDGYLGEHPVQVKPASYRVKDGLPETMRVPVVYYEKTKSGVRVEASAVTERLGRI